MELKLPQFVQSILPPAWRNDTRAIRAFTADFEKVKAELDLLKKKGTKRINNALSKRRTYVAAMQQDELKLAVEWARDPQRPRRDILYNMYDEVWDNDGHTIGETRKAILKVVGSPFGVFKHGSEEIDEQATRLLQKKWFEDYRKYFEQTQFWGHSLVQFVDMVESKEKGMKMEFKKVDLIDRHHVRPEEGFIVLDVSDESGIPFRDEKFKRGLMLMEMGEPNYLGLLRLATKEFIWKNYSRSDWSRHSEKFGMPMIVIKSGTTNDKELDELENMARDFGNNLWAILRDDDEVELKEPTFKDSYQIYKELAMFCNQEVSKAISGATGTSDEKAFVGGAEVHERILNEFVEANKRGETYHINEELFPFLCEHGYPFEDKEFRYLEYQNNDPEEDEPEAGGKPKPKGGGGRPAGKDQRTRRTSTRALFT